MRAIKSAAIVVLAVLAAIVSLALYRRPSRRVNLSPRPSAGPSAAAVDASTELPLVEYRESHSGPGGETGTLLTIDRNGLATVQTLPLGPGSNTTRGYIDCDEFAALPEEMRYPLEELRASYGPEQAADVGEVTVVSRFGGRERKVVWRNPESRPKPPKGVWAGLVAPLEIIRRKVQEIQEMPPPAKPEGDIVVEYGQLSSGVVGTYITELVIHQSGEVSLGHGLHGPWPVGITQISREEVANLRRTFEEAKFMEFQRCYGQHAPVNPQNSWITYQRNGTAKIVTWMSDGSDPRPPEGWFRIVAILDEIRARIKPRKGAL